MDREKNRKDFLDALLELKGEVKDGSANISDKRSETIDTIEYSLNFYILK